MDVAEDARNPVSKHHIPAPMERTSMLTRDGTAKPISREIKFSGANEDWKKSAGHGHDWQPYPVDTYLARVDNEVHSYIG